ncbi:helix-turn-helix DNA binding domain protein [Rhodobacter phage RcKvothe]|nr:helix-turn-helix DNA binding domain protein [Rhodobacter phage RcKvothe]UUV44918.1 helix-turn-helix DNA binding domain protein [Rhodobacter phage RcSwan]
MNGRIDVDRLPKLVAAGLSSREIADVFGVQPPAVVRACHANGIALPGRAGGAGAGASTPPAMSAPEDAEGRPAPAPEAPEGDPARSALVATGGRGADLSEWAAANGKTITQARQAWFRLGLPLVPKKGA